MEKKLSKAGAIFFRGKKKCSLALSGFASPVLTKQLQAVQFLESGTQGKKIDTFRIRKVRARFFQPLILPAANGAAFAPGSRFNIKMSIGSADMKKRCCRPTESSKGYRTGQKSGPSNFLWRRERQKSSSTQKRALSSTTEERANSAVNPNTALSVCTRTCTRGKQSAK